MGVWGVLAQRPGSGRLERPQGTHPSDPTPFMAESWRRQFHARLEVLQADLIEMAGASEESVAHATKALLERDRDLADRSRKADNHIDELEIRIDEEALELLALQQPLARDLRQIIVTIKIANDLERVGDHAVNIAKATRRLLGHPPIPDVPQLGEMVVKAKRLLADALRAYVTRDCDLARQIPVWDEKVDDLRDALHRILVTHMMEDPARLGPALQLILVSQSLERVADLAVNIAEETVFLVEGAVIRHDMAAAAAARARTT